MIRDCLRGAFDGIGKPEPLRWNLSGFWSRRIDDAKRLVYCVDGDDLVIIACRYHYEKQCAGSWYAGADFLSLAGGGEASTGGRSGVGQRPGWSLITRRKHGINSNLSMQEMRPVGRGQRWCGSVAAALTDGYVNGGPLSRRLPLRWLLRQRQHVK